MYLRFTWAESKLGGTELSKTQEAKLSSLSSAWHDALASNNIARKQNPVSSHFCLYRAEAKLL
jgi:hypothetical protein